MNYTSEALRKKLMEMKDQGASDFLRSDDEINDDENPGPMDAKMKEDEALGNEIADMAPSLDKGGEKSEILRMHEDSPNSGQADIGHEDERMASEKTPNRKMSLMERATEAMKLKSKKS